jgi:hypothetical protein
MASTGTPRRRIDALVVLGGSRLSKAKDDVAVPSRGIPAVGLDRIVDTANAVDRAVDTVSPSMVWVVARAVGRALADQQDLARAGGREQEPSNASRREHLEVVARLSFPCPQPGGQGGYRRPRAPRPVRVARPLACAVNAPPRPHHCASPAPAASMPGQDNFDQPSPPLTISAGSTGGQCERGRGWLVQSGTTDFRRRRPLTPVELDRARPANRLFTSTTDKPQRCECGCAVAQAEVWGLRTLVCCG